MYLHNKSLKSILSLSWVCTIYWKITDDRSQFAVIGKANADHHAQNTITYATASNKINAERAYISKHFVWQRQHNHLISLVWALVQWIVDAAKWVRTVHPAIIDCSETDKVHIRNSKYRRNSEPHNGII